MGWLFINGTTRREMIAERTNDWERTTDDAMTVKTTCLAHCYRGGAFSGVLWTVWERTFVKDGVEVQSTERWIGCDLMRYQTDAWGYKDMEESMFPYYFSCPIKYLDLVPLDKFGGNAEWREGVKRYHARNAEKRRARKLARKR